MRRRQFLALGAATAGAALAPGLTRAEPLAGKQIRFIVPFPAGGPTDIVARPFAQMLGDALKATIVIDNRGGAGGGLGADAVAKSTPDGHTLLMATVGTHAINSALYKKLPYDALKDFTPIGLVAMAPVTIVVHPSLQVNNVAELVALAKSTGSKLNYGSAGVGTPGHLTGEMFKAAAGIELQHVPYRGSAPALTDLLAGQIKLIFDPLQSVLSNVLGGKLQALAISSKARSPVLPSVPTIAEASYPGFETTAWWAVFAPAGIPADASAALSDATAKVARSDEFKSKLEPLGVAPTAMSGSAFAGFQRAEIAKWGKAVRDSGASMD
jgi:tripartite-type tricarboxylate transporter receptor subunit TctC